MKLTPEQVEGIAEIILSYSDDGICQCDDNFPTCPEWSELCPREMAEHIANYLEGKKW